MKECVSSPASWCIHVACHKQRMPHVEPQAKIVCRNSEITWILEAPSIGSKYDLERSGRLRVSDDQSGSGLSAWGQTIGYQ
jgi:hypothetical protein